MVHAQRRLRCKGALLFGFLIAVACGPEKTGGDAGVTSVPVDVTQRPVDAEPTPEELMVQIQGEFAQLGFTLDISELSVIEASPKAAARSLERYQAKVFPSEHYRGLLGLVRVFVPNVPDDLAPEAFGAAVMERLVEQFAALYIPEEKRVVMLDSELAKLSDLDAKLIHELAHAWQDQQGEGIWSLFERGHGGVVTLDSIRARQILLEGHAELMSMAVLLQRSGRTLDELNLDNYENSAGRLLAGETALLYSLGAKYMLNRYKEGGWPAAHAALRADTVSTEQLLHLEKRDRDRPTELRLPTSLKKAGYQVLYDTTIGEFALYQLMTRRGLNSQDAGLAAAGWDGDHMFFMAKGDTELMLWRTVWDRPEDAQAFETVLKSEVANQVGTTVLRRGHYLDIVRSRGASTKQLRKIMRLVRTLPRRPTPDKEDAESARATEAAMIAKHRASAQVEHGFLLVPAAGIRVPIPEGWTARSIKGMKSIVNQPEGGFSDVVTIQVSPNLHGLDMDGLQQETIEGVERMGSLKLVDLTRMEAQGIEMLMTKMVGYSPGVDTELRFLGLSFLRGDSIVTMTAAAPSSRWSRVSSVFAEMFGGIGFKVD